MSDKTRTLADVRNDQYAANKQHPNHDPVSHQANAWREGCARCAVLEPLWDEWQRLTYPMEP